MLALNSPASGQLTTINLLSLVIDFNSCLLILAGWSESDGPKEKLAQVCNSLHSLYTYIIVEFASSPVPPLNSFSMLSSESRPGDEAMLLYTLTIQCMYI